MFTAISSLALHQNYLDVIADNLANANTTGYKASRVVFQDQFAQLMSSGSAPNATLGGINPTQVGLGVKVGYISPLFTQGPLQSTGRSTDLAIQGNGFFIYKDGQETRYSREGSLEIDATGYLVNNSTGMRIQGWTLNPGDTGAVDTNIAPGDMHITMDASIAQQTSEVVLGGNLSSGTATNGTVTTTFGVYDSMGNPLTANVTFTRSANPLVWNWQMVDNNGVATTGNGRLAFTDAGQYDAANSAVTTTPVITGVGGANNVTLTNFDLSKITQLSADSSVTPKSQNGLAAGSFTDLYAAPNSGEIYLVFSNGLKQKIGMLALANFTNPTGLLRAGSNNYKIGLNSGEPQIGAANTGGRGTISSGYLESSNVDMAQEFTNMILAQRGFQASSRVITTSDEIMQELVSLKR
jgi:flagellar hook protein FlgE